LALAYLIVFGSVIALSAYLWLLKFVSPARVITHAYVNPVVAVFLGWALADEPLNWRTLAATAVIVLGVLVIVSRKEIRRAAVPEIEHG
jgi:drug/metabolite transporter (DMT)-like permease